MKNKTERPSILSLKIVFALFVHKEGLTIKKTADEVKADYKNVHNAVEELFNKGVIKKEKIGNYNICKLNYSNEDIIEYLKEHNFYIRLKEFRRKHPTENNIIIETYRTALTEEMFTPFFICLVFGSYTRNEEKENSDIDLLFLPESIEIFKKILSKANASYQKKFHVVEQSISGFLTDLANKNKLSIATELSKEPPIVFYGEDIFFRMMVEDRKR